MRLHTLLFSSLFLSYAVLLATAVQCGEEAGGGLCPGEICCSKWGYCGTTNSYCLVENGCQLNCSDGDSGGGGGGGRRGSGRDGGALGDIISSEMFEEMLPYRNHYLCPAANFYTYDAFIAAAKLYPDFAATGDNDTRKREVAAFLGQTSEETTGRKAGAEYAWGYCYNENVNCLADYCDYNPNYPCYHLSFAMNTNYNYGQFGESIGQKYELLQHPELLKTNVTLSFMSALWFWMTAQPPKPSCHSVITGEWKPSAKDIAAGRLPGYGVTINIINGGFECGKGGPNDHVENRINYYERYCDMLGVSYGPNLDCYNQVPFNQGLLLESI
ncbi:endochitinase 2 [Gossypium hirsutum]|uniref:Endochitinase 2 n=1 Tax=Gossypium hirsutum TaxID=3635 RepID=A0ABM3AA64_GOSHI|nr:endochitinase 2-like [Gossypium hirsutum]